MQLDKHGLCRLIPHSDSMCLLDSVEFWDQQRVVCHTNSHLLIDNPLRRDGQLSAVNAIEYGAQGMAVHGGLLAESDQQRSAPAYLVSLKGVSIDAEQSLDQYKDQLIIEARKVFADGGNLIYDFSVSTNTQTLVSGQAMVMKVETDS